MKTSRLLKLKHKPNVARNKLLLAIGDCLCVLIVLSDAAFTVNVQCLYRRLRHKPTVAWDSENSTVCTSFSLSIKRRASSSRKVPRADMMSVFFYLSRLCCFGYYQKLLSKLLFCKFTPLMMSLAVILTHYSYSLSCHYRRYSVHTFLNTRKSLVGHSKKSVTLTSSKAIKFYLSCTCM